MNHPRPFTLQIHAPFGEPEGLRIIEKDNWTGRAVAFPRPRMSHARQVDELARTGVYILRASDPARLYIGESDNVLKRLGDHDRDKDWWAEAVGFTSTDDNLTKAHTLYMEASLAKLAADADRAALDNRIDLDPAKFARSRADKATAETFLENILICLRALGIHEFDPLRGGAAAGQTGDQPTLYHSSSRPRAGDSAIQIEASGTETLDGFVIHKGSHGTIDPVPSFLERPEFASYARKRAELLASDKVRLDPERGTFEFIKDVLCSSPSLAIAYILGRAPDMSRDWKDEHGTSLKDLREAGQAPPRMTQVTAEISAQAIDVYDAVAIKLSDAVENGAFKVLQDDEARRYSVGWSTFLTGAVYDFQIQPLGARSRLLASLEVKGMVGSLISRMRRASDQRHLENIVDGIKTLAESEDFYRDDDAPAEPDPPAQEEPD